jgi:hypothetical protein
MARGIMHDGSTGDVVIRSGPPISGGGGGWGGGVSFGGNRVGASGAFSGPSKRTKEARRRAREAYYQKEAAKQAQALIAATHAREQAKVQSRNQTLAQFTERQSASRAEINGLFASRGEHLASSLEDEISASKTAHTAQSSERWQLYLITKEKSEIDGLITQKNAQLSDKKAIAQAFDGHDPITRTADDYLIRLGQFGDAMEDGHQLWETAYNAAQEARLLSAQLDALSEKSSALATRHAEQTIVWRERDANWERHRQVAEQRGARIRFKQQADEDARIERVRQANTLNVSAGSLAAGGLLLTPQGAVIAQEISAIGARVAGVALGALTEVGFMAARAASIFVTAMVHSPVLGNGELTQEQRNSALHAFSAPAQTLGLHDRQELQAIADAGGSVEVEYRLKTVAVPEGTAIIIVSTGGEIDSRVPVVNAVLDPLSGLYLAEIPGSPTRLVQITPDTTPHYSATGQARLAVTDPLVQNIPNGVDLRIQDCIVCVPGLEPIYLSFNVPPMGTGVVTGTGQPATAQWWTPATQAVGAAIPTQIGDQFRGREFTSFEAFDKALWQTLGEDRALASSFNELNKKRIEQGFAPYAPKSTWVGENREFELRYQERPEFWADPFNLDKISIKTPNNSEGWIGLVPVVVPWPMPPASTWKPLVPPGSEHLGSTTSPITPTDPLIYPGSPVIPVLPQNETFPAVDEGEISASIPGFPGDMALPSPDALFRDRRDDPGIATGVGQAVSGVWLGEATRGEGAAVPAQIADQLRLQEFRNFLGFRRAFWKAIQADAELRTRFSAINLHLMKSGKAPLAPPDDTNGGRVKYEIHHIEEVAKGGAVYDMDNLAVMTPRRHIDLHGKGN